MKRISFIPAILLAAGIFMMQSPHAFGQFTDSTYNYFTITEYYDDYFDSLLLFRVPDNMQGTGFKDYLRWKWFYTYRHGEDGNLGDFWRGFINYHDDYQPPDGYTDESNWHFIGPFGIPLGHENSPVTATGKGMMLSIWVDDGDHSLIYAGSHHSGLWKTEVRKVMIPDDNPGYLFFLNYRHLFRSTDQGENWTEVFYKQYFPWDENDINSFGPSSGLFDFEVTPWDTDVAYLAGNEVFEVSYPYGSFDTTNISEEIFYAGLNTEDYDTCCTERCEITMHENFPDMIWFCYHAQYITITDDTINLVRVASCDRSSSPPNYELIYSGGNEPGLSRSMFEFEVSPSDGNIFYLAGIYLQKLDLNPPDPGYHSIRSGSYPGDCWVHDDIRDMQLFSDGNGHDTLYLADDSGISWGTEFEPGQPGCNDYAWHWRHPCASMVNGLNVTEFYGLGLFENEPYLLAGGCQDLSSMLRDEDDWINFFSGDGSEAIFDPDDPNIIYFTEWQFGQFRRSNDKGATNEELYDGDYSFVIMPMTLDPKNPSIIYIGAKSEGINKLIRITGANDFSPGFDPSVEELYTFEEPITAIKVVTTGPGTKRIYVSTRKYYKQPDPPSSEFSGCIFYSDDGINFTDISANLVACRYGFISDIEFNPNNTDQVWVSTALYSVNNQHDKVYTLTLPGTNWQACAYQLPEGIPVYKVRYISPLRQLFALTDVGIFTRNIDENQWYPFNNNLPKKIMIDMEVNLKHHKIVAATYGRGIWETELAGFCDNNLTNVTISDQQTWTEDMLLHGNIHINSGGVLEIENCKVYMPENSKIVVKNGGKLILDGATITSSYLEPWDGIEVWGSNNYQNYSQYFGYIELKNNTAIENAYVSIRNYCKDCDQDYLSGGIIEASGAVFRNNQIAVEYVPFVNMYNGVEHPYRSFFSDCTFEFDGNHLENIELQYFIKMDQVNGVRFAGCDFVNSVGLTGSQGETEKKYGSGIYSLGSQYYVDEFCPVSATPCPNPKPSTFIGLNYGIYAMGIDPLRTLYITRSVFSDNVTGVYLRGITNSTVTLNEFHVNEKFPGIYEYYAGLYLDFCTGYTIEENTITHDEDLDFNNYGIVVKDSGPENNEIYNNFFQNRFLAGIAAYNKNRGDEDDNGLVIKCNEFEYEKNFENCILVEELDTNNITINSGIANNQGSDLNDASPAGNLFSRNEHPGFFDYSNLVTVNTITYFMHDPSTEERVEPLDYTSSITLSNTGFQFIKEDACPSNFSTPGPNPELLKTEMDFESLKIDTAQSELDSWVDGGDTEQAVSDVIYSTPPEAYDLYSDLLIKSPYLSDTVMKESIQKESVLNNVMIEDILVANPQSAKSATIQDALDNRSNPLSEEQRDSVNQGLYTVSSKEILESRVAGHKHHRAMLVNDLLTVYKNDTVNDWAKDSLIAFINQENIPGLLYQLAFIRLKEGDTIQATNTLDYIQNNFDLNSIQQVTHQQYDEYADHYYDFLESYQPPFNFDSLSLVELYSLAVQESFPGSYARNLLAFYDTLVYYEPYAVPSGQNKSGSVSSGKPINSDPANELFRIYPNPAMSYFVTEYPQPGLQIKSLDLLICKITGEVLKKISLPVNSNHKIIGTRGLIPGFYLCKFVVNDKEKQSLKLSVIK